MLDLGTFYKAIAEKGYFTTDNLPVPALPTLLGQLGVLRSSRPGYPQRHTPGGNLQCPSQHSLKPLWHPSISIPLGCRSLGKASALFSSVLCTHNRRVRA
jgi:hypothetical protein